MREQKKIMIVAGEPSGDGHAAKLVRAFRDVEPGMDFTFFGAAGPEMREAGVEPIVASDDLSIVGLTEIAMALPIFLRAARVLKKAAVERKPDVVILVDFPDFNLKLAKSLKKRGFLITNYISPQLWAWRRYRVSTVRKYVDLMITILPFEKSWYSEHGVHNVEFVGSPLAREVHSTQTREEFCLSHSLDPAKPIISLLPGSRHKEIARIFPVMLEAAVRIAADISDFQFLVAIASDAVRKDIEQTLANTQAVPANLTIVSGETYNALNASDAAAVTSGTATLEAGIIGTPMVIVYKTSALNFKLLEPMITVEHYGLINLIASKRVATELIQNELTAEILATELLRILEPSENVAMRAELKKAAEKLGQGGASKRAAEAILKLMP